MRLKTLVTIFVVMKKHENSIREIKSWCIFDFCCISAPSTLAISKVTEKMEQLANRSLLCANLLANISFHFTRMQI